MILYPSCQRNKIKTEYFNTFKKHKKLNKKIKYLVKKCLTKKNKKSIINKLYHEGLTKVLAN